MAFKIFGTAMSNEYEYQFNTMNIWEQIIKQNAFSFLFHR